MGELRGDLRAGDFKKFIVLQVAYGNAWEFNQKLSAGEIRRESVGDFSYRRHAVYGEKIRAGAGRNVDGWD